MAAALTNGLRRGIVKTESREAYFLKLNELCGVMESQETKGQVLLFFCDFFARERMVLWKIQFMT